MGRIWCVAFAALVACQAPDSAGTGSDTASVSGQEMQVNSAGLVQRVTLTPGMLVSGQNVRVRSVLINRGAARITVENRICGLDFRGTLALSQPPDAVKCAGYSQSTTLAAGDSVVGFDIMRVDSPSGAYTVRVQHALSPAFWYEASIRVSR